MNGNIDLIRRLPAVLAFPLRFVPGSPHSRLLALLLNRVFAAERKQGLLDFLAARTIAIDVKDMRLRFHLGFSNRQFDIAPARREPDLLLQADAYEFMLLAAREEDPDTLMFQRRLNIEGNTELGLMLKNFIDGMDLDHGGLPAHVASLLRTTLQLQRTVVRKTG